MNKIAFSLATLALILALLALNGCKNWDFEVTPAQLQGPTSYQPPFPSYLPGETSCLTPEQEEKEYYKLQVDPEFLP